MMAVFEDDLCILNEAFQSVELRVGCPVCVIKEEEITYSVKFTPHRCQENFLIARFKNAGKCWRPISARPKYPQPMRHDVCWFFVEGSGCTEHGRRCTFARSREEVFIWDFLKRHSLDLEYLISLLGEAEQNVSNLERVSEKILADWSGEFQELCKECFNGSPRRITERESSYACDSDLGHRWKPMIVHSLARSPGNRLFSEIRPLPPNALLQLCCQDTKDTSTGHSPLECQFAHSKVELAVWKQEVNSEWNRRELLWLSYKRRQTQHTNVGQSPATTQHTSSNSNDISVPEPEENETSYQDILLKEYRDSGKEIVILSEYVDDVEITHDEDLYLECPEVATELKWSFQIKTERLLSHVALLKNEPGAKFNLGDAIHSKRCTYSVGKTFVKSGLCYEVPVTFTSTLPGLYEQWLVFDFDMRPVLLQKLKVRVGQSTLEPEEVSETVVPILERWNKGNRTIIPYFPYLLSKTQDDLLKTYEIIGDGKVKIGDDEKVIGESKVTDFKTAISQQNYKESMHIFLFQEELEEAEIVSRLDFRGTITLSDSLACPHKDIYPGELCGVLAFNFTTTQGAPEGVLLKREVKSVLVGEVASSDQNVYQAVFVKDAANEKEIHLKLSKNCCRNMSLKRGQTREVEVQFQLNRLSFCEMHKAIDHLQDLDKVLPDFTKCCIPSHSRKYPKVNANQQAAMEFILGEADGENSVAPLLIYGPFGTGKTFTLALAAKEVVCQLGGRVLICTHTNSSADIYISRHFDQFLADGHHEVKPLRIKTTKNEKAIKATDWSILKYCLLSPDRTSFIFPRRQDLDKHRIVITTTSWAKNLCEFNLPENYFSHIMIDEASQMLECEALMALSLAGPKTRVVLAGDHMQMGPKLFSVEDHKRADHTLLNRLFYYYHSEKGNVATESRVIFNENYRSNEEIVNFVSSHFYTGKKLAIRTCGNVPGHPKHYPLRFYHVRGEWHLHPKTQSWYNLEEAERVVNIVRELFDDWPAKEWGPEKREDICVLSEGHQVQVVRDKLRGKRLGVLVENLANVQGKQFRVIVITTVQTRDQLLQPNASCLEFFNDGRVLNTAMTRAQSQVIVVGDAAALSYFGKCAKTWRCYVELCIKSGSAKPHSLTKDFLRMEMEEISRFQKTELNVDSEDTPLIEEDQMDLILQQMIREYADGNYELSDQESEAESYCPPRESTRISPCIKKHKHMQTHAQKPRSLTWHTLTLGHTARSEDLFDDTFENAGGLVHTVQPEKGRDIVGENFLCVLDDFCPRRHKDSTFTPNIMVSIRKDARKICVLSLKHAHSWMPIYEQKNGHRKMTGKQLINEQLRQNHLFTVQVICWKKHCLFPLGYVIGVDEIGRTIHDSLKVLNAKFNLNKQLPPRDFKADVDDKVRVDLRDIMTFTIDSKNATHLDDAISVHDAGSHYEVGIHIADVASFLKKGDALDRSAENMGATYYHTGPEESVMFMFPESVSMEHWSLLPKEERRVISLIIKVDKNTGLRIHDRSQKTSLQLSMIRSDYQLTYERVDNFLNERSENGEWGDGSNLICTTWKDCVVVAYRFSQVCRKDRLRGNWLYSQPDKDKIPGRRRSHLLVEEFMIMFNHEMSRYLTSNVETISCSPLRCQKPPHQKGLIMFRDEFMDLIPMSAHLKHHLQYDEQDSEDKPFTVLSTVWSNIKKAAQRGQYDAIADLIGTDDSYPQLLPVISKFRAAQTKAYTIRSNSCEDAHVGHYSLALDTYTKASSPMRRYMDVVLQRLFHSAYSGSCVQYSQLDIDTLCEKFDKLNQNVKDYEKQAEAIILSINLQEQSFSELASVVFVSKQEDHCIVSFLPNKGSTPGSLSLLYRDMLLDKQPKFSQRKDYVKLTWRRRVYPLHNPKELDEGLMKVSRRTWHDISVAVQSRDWARATTLISTCRSTCGDEVSQESESESEDDTQELQDEANQDKHYTEYSLRLTRGETIKVQRTGEMCKGSWILRAQLLYVKPNFVICLEHAHQPTECFTKQAVYHTKDSFRDVDEYVKIWKPLCQMVSASSAVQDGDSITIEDVHIAWKQMGRGHLTGGTFSLPTDCIKVWRIECNLAQCYLCIKKRNLRLAERQIKSEHFCDPCTSFTWIVHGVVTSCTRSGMQSRKQSKTVVEFDINHRSMSEVPGVSDFSVELIPKLPPDVRTENAINNIVNANDLVQKIVLGRHIDKEVFEPTSIRRIMKQMDFLSRNGLPELNDSQRHAVMHAVNNKFTLIQGPPGTGKTVVGAYIAYMFSKRLMETVSEDKKEVVFYCGPSNKSVDVVAEYLLKFEDKLKPLRVYGKQTEIQEFPYPGSNIQLSRKSRQERPSPLLRSITLHYRIRDVDNPFSQDIKAFDEKISRREKSKPISEAEEKEIEQYKELLNKAREYELKKHNVILCTCTAASSANLTKLLSAKMILIDECAMATEPQTLIPLVSYNPQKIVLLGDHKQLRPIVTNQKAKIMGMSKSLFERCINLETHRKAACTLITQYRMHEQICMFPSSAYYDNKLKTRATCRESVLQIKRRDIKRPTRVVFVDMRGKEISQFVSTSKGNEKSVRNCKESIKATKIAASLVSNGGINEEDIAILSPYNAQVSDIKSRLNKKNLTQITVCTITKSQGSEWRYVIISVVRSCTSEEIKAHNTEPKWRSKHIGFVGDANQINVGITRAKDGLCILGNQELLSCNKEWQKLLSHYMENHCVVTATEVDVCNMRK